MNRIGANKRYRGKTIIDKESLDYLKNVYRNKGWQIAKWMDFVGHCLKKGYEVERYAAISTESNYITVYYNNRSFKVRFSTHKAARHKEYNHDCDFYVGKTVNGFQSTSDAIEALEYFLHTDRIYTFEDVKNAVER